MPTPTSDIDNDTATPEDRTRLADLIGRMLRKPMPEADWDALLAIRKRLRTAGSGLSN